MKEHVGDNAHGDSFRDGIHEGHSEDGDVGRDGFERIFPGDLGDLLHHQITDDDQGRGRREGRDRQEQGREEEGQDEEEACGDSCQAGASALSDTGGGLDEGRDSRSTKAGAYGRADCVREQGAADVGELAVLVQHICLGGASDQGSQCVEQVNKEEGRNDREEVQTNDIGEVQLHESRCQLADHAQKPCEDDTDQDVAGNFLDDQVSTDDHADQGQQDRDAFIIEGTALDGIAERKYRDQRGAVNNDMGVLKTDEADEKADTDRYTQLQGRRYRIEDRLPDIGQRQDDENDTFCENGGQGDLPGIPHAHDDRVGQIGVQAHTCGQSEGQICQERHQNTGDRGCQRRRRKDSTLIHAGISQNAGIDSQDIGHCHEGRDAGHDLCFDIRPVFLQFKKPFQNNFLLYAFDDA